MKIEEENYVAHYGILRRSGRYPWGSGEYPEYARNQDFVLHVESMRHQGVPDTKIAEGQGMSLKDLRVKLSNSKAYIKAADTHYIQTLKDKGWSNTAIGEHTGLAESTIRSYLAPGAADKRNKTQTTANMLKDEVAEKTYIDVGVGVENRIGISRTTLDKSIGLLKDEGYMVHPVKQRQLLTGNETKQVVLCPPGTTQRDLFLNKDKVQQIGHFSDDDGRTIHPLKPAMIIDPKRLDIVYGAEGKKADGIIYVRPDVDDVSLGGKQYAQVRVRIGDGHYLKGMAMYKNDLPKGVDLQFNTAKKDTGNKLDALKEVVKDLDGKVDPLSPFGTWISNQYRDSDGNLISSMNIVNEEGDWDNWARTLSSQMLSKQSLPLATTQLKTTYDRRVLEYESIMALTNNTVKKKLLEDFADSTDNASVHLKAAQLPRQAVAVLLPISTMKPTEVYAPKFNDGEEVVLVRHPHGGTFEIPRLRVNNKHAPARKLIGKDATDAIGIHHSVAERLSGADFDGDTVLVIPTKTAKILSTKALEDLKNFDPVSAYPGGPGIPVMSNTQMEMGKISNLITDMSLRGANEHELARAVKHSMVVIDAEKKELNHRLSYQENGIGELKKKYQEGGASTLISRKKRPIRVPDRKLRTQGKGGPIDKVTGEVRYEPTGKTYIDRDTGERILKKIKVPELGETQDARTLITPPGTAMEAVYAEHSNRLKRLANQARLDAQNTPPHKQVKSSKKTYEAEVKSLDAALHLANMNRPLERQAHIIGQQNVRLKKQANPGMDKDTKKKVERLALEEARARIGAKTHEIKISDREWEAIQAGAISDSKLQSILNYADDERVRELATPKTQKLMTPTATRRAKQMADSGYTQTQIAQALHVSLSTLKLAIAE